MLYGKAADPRGSSAETSPSDSSGSEPKVRNVDAQAQPARAVPRRAKPPTGIQKPPTQLNQQNKLAKPVRTAEARSRAVYHAMERLLDRGAFSDADLLQAVTNLSGDEFLQVNLASLPHSCYTLVAKLSLPLYSMA